MGSPCEGLDGILMLMPRLHEINASPLHQRQSMIYVQRREPGPSAGIPELDEIVLAARYKQAHRWVPLDALDVPSMAGKDALLAALRKGPNAHGSVITGSGEARVVWRKTESAYGFAMCGPRGEVVHVGLEILDDTGLVCGRDVRAGVVEGECADGGIVSLEDSLKIECQPVPCRELPTRGTGQYAPTLWRPLGATSGRRHR